MRSGWLCLLMLASPLVAALGAEPSDQAQNYLFAGRIYGPEEYCEFGGGIPKHYVEICERLRPGSRQAVNARSDRAQRWVRLEADNGAAFAIDVGDIGHPEGGIVAAKMCQLDVGGHQCVGGPSWILDAKLFWFDCRGYYADVTNAPAVSGWLPAPQDSVIGRASTLACDQKSPPSE